MAVVDGQEFDVALTAASASPAIMIEDGLPPPGPLRFALRFARALLSGVQNAVGFAWYLSLARRRRHFDKAGVRGERA